MEKQEFLDSLRRSLNGNLEPRRVEEHLRYYSDYIDSQLRQGISQEEVMYSLGDPRLIAKTLVGVGDNPYVAEEYVETEKPKKENLHYYRFKNKNIAVPAWLSSIVISIVLVVVLGLFFALLGSLLQFAFPIIVVVFAYRALSKFFR